MDSFPVICETCHARLRVRSTSLIGEIHACPKCGSMVQIVPPADWSPPEGAPSSTGAAAAASGDAPQGAAAATDSSAAGAAEGIDALLRQAAGSADDHAHVAAAPVGPRMSPASRLVLWSAGGAGLLVVGTLAAAMWVRAGADAVDPSPAAPTDTTATVIAPAATADEVPLMSAAEVTRSPQPVESVEARPALPELPSDEVVASADLPSAPSAVASDRIAATRDSSSASAEAAAPRAAAPARFDPLDFDPAQLNLSSAGSAGLVRPAAPKASAANALGETSALPEQADMPGQSLPPLEPTAPVRLGPVSSGDLRARNVAEQLSLRLSAVELPQVPLSRLLEMLSDMAAVPITLEPSALEMSGISPSFPVTLSAQDVTIAELLTTAVSQCGLAYDERDGQVVVTKPDVDARRTVNYQVDDLVGAGQSDAGQLAKLIEAFVAPATWRSSGGSGTATVDGTTLRVAQLQRVHYQVLTFCERLRLARGLATRSRYPVERLPVEPAYPQLDARLSAKTTFTFLPWTRLADVLRHWEDAAGVTVLVDWPALAELDLAPSSPVACSIADRTWSDALDMVLTPLGLAWRAVDARTIQITSRAASRRTAQIEFYPVAPGLLDQYTSPEALVAQLVDEAKKLAVGKVSGTFSSLATPHSVAIQTEMEKVPDTFSTPVEIQWDGPSRRLVVRAPPEVHRYLSGRLVDRVD